MKDLNYEEALLLLKELKKQYDCVQVFTDRGWGDDPEVSTIYSIIIDGDGQNPKAYITEDTFNELKKNKVIGKNCLQTYKARTLHPCLSFEYEI